MKVKPLQIGNKIARLPLIQGGMGVGVSLSRLAGAVAKAGGVGIISTAQIGFEEPDFAEDSKTANLRAMSCLLYTSCKLRLNDFCNFLRGMGLDVIHTLLKGIGEGLQKIRMSSKVALFCTVGGVWYVAGGFAERSNYIALSFLLKCSSGRLKFDCIICRRTISGKGSSGGTKIDTLVDGQVSSRIDAIFLQYEFKYHLRHEMCIRDRYRAFKAVTALKCAECS